MGFVYNLTIGNEMQNDVIVNDSLLEFNPAAGENLAISVLSRDICRSEDSRSDLRLGTEKMLFYFA